MDPRHEHPEREGSAAPHWAAGRLRPRARLVTVTGAALLVVTSLLLGACTPPAGLTAATRKTIVIDPGHDGGNGAALSTINQLVDYGGGMRKTCDTTGTAANDGYRESAYNLDVARRLAAVLQAAGAHVVLTRSTDTGVGPCVPERAAIGNRAHADVAISIHADGNTSPTARGFHVIAPKLITGLTDAIYTPSKRLSLDVRDAFDATGMPRSTYVGANGLIERDDLGGLRLSAVPKVFIETGNMRNPSDIAKLENPVWRQLAANALAHGLARYLAGH